MFAEEKINRVANAVDGAIQIHPLPATLDVGLIDMPLAGDGAHGPIETLQQQERKSNDPAMNGGMIDADAPFGYQLFEVLDKARAKHPGMVLLHGGSPKGAEFIASRWAEVRKVPQIAFKPDWNRHAKSAPFKRNDQLLQTLPIGIIVFPGSGITDNLADKARTMGIPVWRFGAGA